MTRFDVSAIASTSAAFLVALTATAMMFAAASVPAATSLIA